MSKICTFLLAVFIVCEALVIGVKKLGKRLQKAADLFWSSGSVAGTLVVVLLVISTSYSYDQSMPGQPNAQVYYNSFIFLAGLTTLATASLLLWVLTPKNDNSILDTN